MAATGYTPIQLYYSTTASNVPLAANMANGELAINIADGKIYYKNSSGVVTLFGSSGDVSTISFGTTGLTPSTATGGAVTVAGTLVAANGGTGQSSYTAGDLIYASGSTALSKLAIGTNGYVLTSSGSAPQWTALSSIGVTTFSAGTTGLTPSSATAGAVTLAGTLNVANGGTGLTSLTAGYIPFGNATSAYGSSANLFWDSANNRMYLGGATSIPLTTTAITPLSIIGQALIGTSNATVSSNKDFRILGGAYTNNAATIINFSGQSAANTINYGGATSTGEPATSHIWYTGTIGSLGAGSERMRLDSSGNLGIGTSSPSQALDITRSAASAYLSTTNGTVQTVYGTSNGASAGLLGTFTNHPQVFWTNNAEKMRLDTSGNLGLGVTPSAWNIGKAMQIGSTGNGFLYGSSNGATSSTIYGVNAYYNGGWKYDGSGYSTYYEQSAGSGFHAWFTAPSGTAGNAITFTQAMTLDASGNLGIGTSSPAKRLHLYASNDSAAIRFQNTAANKVWEWTPSLPGTANTGFSLYNVTDNLVPFRVLDNGDVGIGISSPLAALDVYRSGGSNLSITHSTSGGTYPKASGISFGASSTSLSVSSNGSTISFVGGAGIYANNTASSGNPTNLVFWTNDSGSPAERMRIASNGYVGVGTTSPTALLHTAGSSSVAAFRTPNILEISTVSATAATGTINYDVTTQSVVYYTSNASGNFTLNFRGSSGTSLNTIMNTGDTVTVTFLCTNGSTAYYNSAVQVDGSSVTPKWLGGTAPTSGNASSVDAYTYAIIKTGSAAFTVLASQTKFA